MPAAQAQVESARKQVETAQPSGSDYAMALRALAMNPSLVLADEPTGNLDTKSAQLVFDLLHQVNQTHGTTILLATHNHALAYVSDAWLAHKATHEKGFSNASFDAKYLTYFPLAVVRKDDEIIAFANLWRGPGKGELSVDLMRHLPDVPNGTMDFLFTELLLWGRQKGYRWFNFGMAPLCGLQHAGTAEHRG